MKKILKGERAVQTFSQCGVSFGERKKIMNFKGSAFVKITEGCSNHCSFCAIPLIRGELRSRPLGSIISEIKELVKGGVYEINLIGQDLAAYGTGTDDKKITEGMNPLISPLCQLLEKISEIEGDFIVRLLYIHPDHFNKDILGVFKKDSRFVHYFDIPFQSGDDGIILSMNRTGSQKKYIELVEEIRAALPDCMLRTTFLAGFPGETDKASENTLSFLKKIQPDWSGCFPYSREEDTPAYSMKGRVPVKTAKARAEDMENLQTEITAEKIGRFVGKEVKVLVEEVIDLSKNGGKENGALSGELSGSAGAFESGEALSSELLDGGESFDSGDGLAIGRGWFQAPEVDGSIVIRYDADSKKEKLAVKPGNVITVRILSATGVDLDSRFVSLVKEFPKDSRLQFLD